MRPLRQWNWVLKPLSHLSILLTAPPEAAWPEWSDFSWATVSPGGCALELIHVVAVGPAKARTPQMPAEWWLPLHIECILFPKYQMLTAAMKPYASFLKLLPPPPLFNQSGLPITWSLPWMSVFILPVCSLVRYPSPASFPSNPLMPLLFWSKWAQLPWNVFSLLKPDRGNVAWGTHRTLSDPTCQKLQKSLWNKDVAGFAKVPCPFTMKLWLHRGLTQIVCQAVAMLQACLRIWQCFSTSLHVDNLRRTRKQVRPHEECLILKVCQPTFFLKTLSVSILRGVKLVLALN